MKFGAMITIAIVDDKYLNRNDRKLELEYHGKIKVLFTAQNGLEFRKNEVAGKAEPPGDRFDGHRHA